MLILLEVAVWQIDWNEVSVWQTVKAALFDQCVVGKLRFTQRASAQRKLDFSA